MEDQITQMLVALQASINTLAPGAWAALIFTTRLTSILQLVFTVLALASASVWWVNLFRIWTWAQSKYDREPAAAIGTIVAALLTILAFVFLFDANTWLGLFYPEAAVLNNLIHHKGS